MDSLHIDRTPRSVAASYFKSKGYDMCWNWWELWEAVNTHSFTVAKAARADLIGDIRDMFTVTLERGWLPDKFIDELEPTLRKKGWWGRKFVEDPHGNMTSVQLGSRHRLRIIYDTNMRTALALASYQSQTAATAEFPYWMYDASGDRTRPGHAAMHGLVFRHDDPIWQTHYPPNGFRCDCRVRAFSRADLVEQGLQVASGEGHLRQITQRVGVDQGTGEIVYRPGTLYETSGGIRMAPDPGWNYNPGDLDVPLSGEIIAPPFPPATNLTDWRIEGLARRDDLPRGDKDIPRLVRTDKPNSLLERRSHIYMVTETAGFKHYVFARPDGRRDIIYTEVATPDGLENVLLSESFVSHVATRDAYRDQFARYILPTLKNPAEVWRQWVSRRDGSVAQRSVYIARYHDEIGYFVAEDTVEGVGISWTFFTPDERYMNRRRKGVLLYVRNKDR